MSSVPEPQQRRRSRIGVFVTPSEIRAGAEALTAHGYDAADAECLRLALDYAARFLARSNRRLGRAGPVCPFISGAIRGDFLRFAVSAIDEQDLDRLPALAERLFAMFDEQVRGLIDDSARLFASSILLFPRLVTDRGFAAVERTQSAAKPAFVERGYMIGEFYPGNRAPGLNNPDFHPLDAPFASLAMRRMTISDAPFMLGNTSFESAFIRYFGGDGETSLEQAVARYGNAASLHDDRAMRTPG